LRWVNKALLLAHGFKCLLLARCIIGAPFFFIVFVFVLEGGGEGMFGICSTSAVLKDDDKSMVALKFSFISKSFTYVSIYLVC